MAPEIGWASARADRTARTRSQADEGEGDRSLDDWRRMHTAYFTRRGEFSADMELYCERFTLIEVLKGE